MRISRTRLTRGHWECDTLRGLRIPNGPAQAMETERMKEVGRPSGGLSSAKMTAVALEEQAFQSPVRVVIDLPKLDGGITCAEVRAPATQAPD